MKILNDVQEAKHILRQGGLIAYPTEAVYGLGCDPFNAKSVDALIALKGRGSEKGFILLIASYSQLFSLIDHLTETQLAKVKASWPGFITWVFPASPKLPPWITGGKNTIAIRMSDHPTAKALCEDFPIISTSANRSGQPPIKEEHLLVQQFPTGIDGYLQNALGPQNQPSPIFDVTTGQQIR